MCFADLCESPVPGVCGDGSLDPGESCDAGDENGRGKVCNANCELNICGDGDQGPGESCDDGNLVDTDACTAMCAIAVCGDGIVQQGLGEVCDDGNILDGDDCSAECAAQTEVLQVYAGVTTSCAILTGGRVKCWGLNFAGGLGLGDTEDRGDDPGEMGAALPYVDLGAGKSAVQIAFSQITTCALLADATVKCWGYNASGQLGQGDTEDRGDQPGEMGDALPAVDLGANAKVVQLTGSSEAYLCALLDSGRVKCWGSSYGGQLGLGDEESRGDMPGEMGDLLPAVDLGAGKQALLLELGYNHACVLLKDDTVKCWGQNYRGQLGIGDDLVRGDDPGEMGDALPALDFGANKPPLELALGSYHSCARWADLTVRCWGLAAAGVIGQGAVDDIGDQIGEMGDLLPAVNIGGPVTAIRAGGHYTCGQLQSGVWKCWGGNDFGQLGQGDTEDRGDDIAEMGDALPALDLGVGRKILEISTGHFHSCALLDDKSVRCWGANGWGNLGLGDTEDRGDDPGEMGDALPPVVLL